MNKKQETKEVLNQIEDLLYNWYINQNFGILNIIFDAYLHCVEDEKTLEMILDSFRSTWRDRFTIENKIQILRDLLNEDLKHIE